MTTPERPDTSELRRTNDRTASLFNDANLSMPESNDHFSCMRNAGKLPDSFGNVLMFDSTAPGDSRKLKEPQHFSKISDNDPTSKFALADKNGDGSTDWRELCFFEEAGSDGLLSKSELSSYLDRVASPIGRGSDDRVASPIGRGSDDHVAPPVGRGSDDHVAPPVGRGSDDRASSPDVTPITDAPAEGGRIRPGRNFTTRDGKIFGPDGKEFVAAGFAMYTRNARDEANIDRALAMKPNIIRLAADPVKDSPRDVQKIIDKFTSKGVVVEVEDHSSGNKVEGEKLGKVADWYKQIARANVDNPRVWFGTPNEPNQTPENFVNTERTIYNAIRGTGNKNIVMLQVNYNSDKDIPVQPILDRPDVYGAMDNVVIDHHMYSSSPNAANQLKWSLGKERLSGMPVIVGEFGNATNKKVEDYPSFNAILDANKRGETGAIAWAWEHPGRPADVEANAMFDPNGKLTSYGERVKRWLADLAGQRRD